MRNSLKKKVFVSLVNTGKYPFGIHKTLQKYLQGAAVILITEILMAAPYSVNLFIPHHILNYCSSGYLFGHCNFLENHALLNCSASYCCSISSIVFCDTIALYPRNKNLKKISESCILGIICEYSDYKTLHKSVFDKISCHIKFILCVDRSKNIFNFERINVSYREKKAHGQVIIYDGNDFSNSNLFYCNKEEEEVDTTDFSVNFLVETMKWARLEDQFDFDNKMLSLGAVKYLPVEDRETINVFCKLFLMAICHLFHTFITGFEHSYTFFQWWPTNLTKLILFSAVGKQLHQRLLHLLEVCKEMKGRSNLSLSCRNLIFAIFLDLLLGWTITYYLWHCHLPHKLLDLSMEHVNYVVNGLQRLIHWLMGAPAGLKLNTPLSSSLGHFFLYHIYLWKTYMAIVKPIIATVMEASSVIGVLGVTIFFSLVNDLISMATIHIYCFYGYATRLYGYQASSLCALWRLFRGKKWNPLRQRVDSYTYDVYQLYIGTLLFTVLLFLLPTVVAYYVVFASLRIVVLMVQGLISRIIDVLTILPAYVVVLRVFNSSETKGDIYFSVLNKEKDLVLTMQAIQIPVSSVIKATLPKLHHYQDRLSWKDFLSSLVWGKIIYPL